VVWNNLASQIDGSRPDYQLTNFELSPDQNWILQKAVLLPQSITTSSFTKLSGDTGTYRNGSNPSGTGWIWQCDTTTGVVSNLQSTFSHGVDVFGGFAVDLWLGYPSATLTASNCFFELFLNSVLKVRIAATESISLQFYNGTSWVIVDQMDSSTESETYLNQNNRRLHIDVVPLFDSSFWAQYPASTAVSDIPPDCLQVSINNGDAVLIWKQQGGTFAADHIYVQAEHGQFGLGYSLRQYQRNCTIQEPTQVYDTNFMGDPTGHIFGYLPYGSTFEIDPIYPGGYQNQIAATVEYVGANYQPSTGYCTSTCAINQCALYYAPKWNKTWGGPLFSIGTERIVDMQEVMTFDQERMCRRSAVEVILNNSDGAFSPGQSLNIGNYGVILSWGWVDETTGYNDVTQRFVGMLNISDTSKPTFSNFWGGDGINYCKIVLQDRIIDDQPCGFVMPFDGESILTALWELAIKMGFAPAHIGFPYIPRGSVNDSTYHLSYGTSFSPNWLPEPTQPIWDYMLTLTSNAAAPDAFGDPLPMVLYVDSKGILQCYGYDIGIFEGPPPQPGKTFSAAETFVNGVSTLSQFTSNMSTSSSLANIRTCIVLEGLNPIDGTPVTAFNNNSLIDGSINSNPGIQGYIGLPRPYINISKYLSSQDAANFVLFTAITQLSMPVKEASFGVPAQSGIFPITGYYGNQQIAVYEPFSTGDSVPVGFYVTQIATHYSNQNPQVSFTSQIDCRLYGQYSIA